jgi:hypothetical protein
MRVDMSRPKILFVFYPGHVKFNHGVALLSSLCKKRGIDVSLHLLLHPDDFLKEVSKRYDYVCFSITTSNDYRKVSPFMQVAVEYGHNVLVGGTWVRFLDNTGEHRTCIGEGETLPDFILTGNGELFEGEIFCPDLNSLPLPDYDLFSGYPFERNYGTRVAGMKQLPYFSSRGCPFRCSFCIVNKQPYPLRIRTNVEEDLRRLAEQYKPDSIYFGDSLLPYYSGEWRRSWGDFRFPFFAMIRADVKPDHLEWLIDRGMHTCSFGIESGDETFRNKTLNKQLNDEDIYRTVGILKKHGIEYVPFYIVGAPGEKFTVTRDTIDMKDRVGGVPIVWDYQSI